MQRPIVAAPKFLTLPALLVLLGGCGGSSSSTPDKTPLSVSAKAPLGMTLTLSEDTSVIPVGGSVTYTLTLDNTSGNPDTVSFATGCASNVSGSRASGFNGRLQVFNPAGRLVNPALCQSGSFSNPITIAPGQSFSGTISTEKVFPAAGGPVFPSPGTFTAAGIVAVRIAGVAQDAPQILSGTVGPLPVTVK